MKSFSGILRSCLLCFLERIILAEAVELNLLLRQILDQLAVLAVLLEKRQITVDDRLSILVRLLRVEDEVDEKVVVVGLLVEAIAQVIAGVIVELLLTQGAHGQIVEQQHRWGELVLEVVEDVMRWNDEGLVLFRHESTLLT